MCGLLFSTPFLVCGRCSHEAHIPLEDPLRSRGKIAARRTFLHLSTSSSVLTWSGGESDWEPHTRTIFSSLLQQPVRVSALFVPCITQQWSLTHTHTHFACAHTRTHAKWDPPCALISEQCSCSIWAISPTHAAFYTAIIACSRRRSREVVDVSVCGSGPDVGD